MTFRRSPQPRKDHVEDEPRDSDHYEFDDARHFATPTSGQSGFARAGQSHEEHMRDDNSGAPASEAAPATGAAPQPSRSSEAQPQSGVSNAQAHSADSGAQPRPGEFGGSGAQPSSTQARKPRPTAQTSHPSVQPATEGPATEGEEGYYGSGGSYGYGGGFEHGGKPGPQEEYRAGGDPGPGNEEFYEATGGFGRDVSGYGRDGLGYPGSAENRAGTAGTPGGGIHNQGGRHYFNEDANRVSPRYFNEEAEDARQGFTQQGGYAQSGGQEPATSTTGDRRASATSAHQPDGGGAAARYDRADERIRADLCEQLQRGEFVAGQVAVEVVGGVVKLEGTVDSSYMKLQAEELASAVMGVRSVQNELQVLPSGDSRKASPRAR